jgi:succinate dehydrogenase hydrophobic anchor subunit
MFLTREHMRLVLVLMALVALLFFVHAPQGSYQAMHGPTSTLKELVFCSLLQLLLLLVAGKCLACLHLSSGQPAAFFVAPPPFWEPRVAVRLRC